jgi:hypothetical protein
MFNVTLDDVRVLEHATIKVRSYSLFKMIFYFYFQVPYEALNKRYRHVQKQIDRDSIQLLASVAELDRSTTSPAAIDSLKRVLERAMTLKRKVIIY